MFLASIVLKPISKDSSPDLQKSTNWTESDERRNFKVELLNWKWQKKEYWSWTIELKVTKELLMT